MGGLLSLPDARQACREQHVIVARGRVHGQRRRARAFETAQEDVLPPKPPGLRRGQRL